MLSEIKRIVKSRLPRPALEAWWKLRRALTQLRFRQLDRRAAFQRIYRENLWGGQRGEFCSGLGSDADHAATYAALVSDFIREHGVRSVVDLGCGDFTVARRFLTDGIRYVGVDIVPELIDHHRRVHTRDGVSFVCLDLVDDPFRQIDSTSPARSSSTARAATSPTSSERPAPCSTSLSPSTSRPPAICARSTSTSRTGPTSDLATPPTSSSSPRPSRRPVFASCERSRPTRATRTAASSGRASSRPRQRRSPVESIAASMTPSVHSLYVQRRARAKPSSRMRLQASSSFL